MRRALVSALAVFAMGLTAAVPVSADTTAVPKPETASALPIRPSKPVTLAPESAALGMGYKIALIALAAAGGVWVWKRRPATGGTKRTPLRTPTLRIAARTAVGVRSELLVVEIEGQNLLLGVTPGSIQRLAVLPDGNGRDLVEADGEGETDARELGFSLALKAAEAKPSPTRLPDLNRIRKNENSGVVTSIDDPEDLPTDAGGLIEEQVRGLLRAARRA